MQKIPIPLRKAWDALLDPDAEFMEDIAERSLAAAGELDRPSRPEILQMDWPSERKFREIVRGQRWKVLASAGADPMPVEIPDSYLDRLSFEKRDEDILVYSDEHARFYYRNACLMPFSVAFAIERKKQRDERRAYLEAIARYGSFDTEDPRATEQQEIRYGTRNVYEFWWEAMKLDGKTPWQLTGPGELEKFFQKHFPNSGYKDHRKARAELKALVENHTEPRKQLK